jgi:hypothetical protein
MQKCRDINMPIIDLLSVTYNYRNSIEVLIDVFIEKEKT